MRIDFHNVILFVLCLVLFLSVFTLSANASPSDFFEITSSMGTVDLGNTRAVTSSPYPVFLAHLGSPYDRLYAFFTDTSILSGSYAVTLYRANGVNANVNCYLPTAHQSGSVYYKEFTGATQDGYSNVPYFATLDDALSAFTSTPVTPSSFSYSLPPGNVAYIEMSTSSAIKLSMDFPELSNSFGTPFSKANSAFALVDSLPSVGSSVASGTVIPWSKSGRLNLIGQTSEAFFGPIGPIATRYVAVINPSYYNHVLVTGTYEQNPPIQIEALNVLSIQVYPLQSAFTFNNDTGQVSTTIAGGAYIGAVDSDTGDIYWTDPDGGSSAPALGGNNLPEAGNSIFDTLRNIASDFSEFLKGPVSAIRVVVSSIREFMGSFTQLYTWLPSPVYNLITSALMIALTIGVIKIFV